MRSTRNIWLRTGERWTSGDYTIVELSGQRFGLIHGSKFVGKRDSFAEAAAASWPGGQAPSPVRVYR